MPGRRAGIAFALAILALAAVVAIEAARIPQSAYAVVGPRVFPFAVAALLGLSGLLLLIQALTSHLSPEDFAGEPVDRRAVGWVGLGLFANVASIRSLGFVLASSLLFLCVARGFGSRRPLRDLAIVGRREPGVREGKRDDRKMVRGHVVTGIANLTPRTRPAGLDRA